MLLQKLMATWLQRGWTAHLLLPIALCYGGLIALRRQLYRMKWLKSHRADAIIIVVGNVVAGGAGKTPTVVEVVKFIQSRGVGVGVVSRGYGRVGSNCEEVSTQSEALEVGDEPMLIQRATKAPVFVASSRHVGAIKLLAKYPGTQVIVCDDGLQHYGLFRDIEICVFDDRGKGNGWLLPSGPLREHWPRRPVLEAGQSDERLMVLHTGKHPKFAGFRATRKLSRTFRLRSGHTVSLEEFVATTKKPILAVAGIAQPELFFNMAREMGLTITQTLAMPDHSDFLQISPKALESFQLICTEKDAFKLWNRIPDAVAIPLEQQSEPAFFEYLNGYVDELISTRLSSANGHKIT